MKQKDYWRFHKNPRFGITDPLIFVNIYIPLPFAILW
jgi:hypothetical protein